MTYTRPLRRTTRLPGAFALTDALTFISGLDSIGLAESVSYPATRQVVWRELDHHLVAGQDADIVLPDPTCGVGEDDVVVRQLDAEIGVRMRLRDGALHFYCVFLGQDSSNDNLHNATSAPRVSRFYYHQRLRTIQMITTMMPLVLSTAATAPLRFISSASMSVTLGVTAWGISDFVGVVELGGQYLRSVAGDCDSVFKVCRERTVRR